MRNVTQKRKIAAAELTRLTGFPRVTVRNALDRVVSGTLEVAVPTERGKILAVFMVGDKSPTYLLVSDQVEVEE